MQLKKRSGENPETAIHTMMSIQEGGDINMIRGKLKSRLKALLGIFAAGALLTLIGGGAAQAQDAFGVSSVLLEKITVTARKREEPIQNVPLSVTHFSSEQIDALKVRDLEDLSVSMPNVALDDIGTVGGIANFSIRGLGINSSIPSVDPTVGVFVDGVYVGATNGTLFDTFDIESIEVLRGPQGTLFGRNVTGGAVLVNTKNPGDKLEMSFRTSFEGGGESLNSYYMGTVGGPLGETVSARITAYTNQDNGWFENLHTGEAFGELDVRMVRPVLVWDPTDDLSLVLRYQYESVDGDGPAAQSHTNGSGDTNAEAPFDRDSHDFSIDEEGKRENDTHFFTAQMDWDVDFGGGTITNIFGWRDSETFFALDLDSSPLDLFHAKAWSNYSQWSNELRYVGRFFEKLHATTGVYYFTNEINYHERRSLFTYVLAEDPRLPAGADVSQFGGGNYDIETLGLFLSLDYDITSQLTLTAGTRYTREERKAEISSLQKSTPLQPIASCNIVEGPACEFDFTGEETWHSWSPKLGAAYYISDQANVYGHWTRGFRSGGYNLRNLIPIDTESPGPYDEETIDSFEAGFKVTQDRGRLYGAVFYNLIDDMQRELNFPIPDGIAQVIRNTADVKMLGFELDGLFAIADNLFLVGSVGYVNPEYTKVKHDLNFDKNIDEKDEALEVPRAAKWTYSVGLTHDTGAASWGRMTSRINYAYRDKSYFTDDNRGYLLEQNILDAGIDIIPANGRFSIGLYGKNLLNEVKHGGDSQLPHPLGDPRSLAEPLGGTFSPLAKGRIFGVQLTYRHRS